MIIMATSFVTPFMGSAVNVAIPAIGRQYEANAILLSWVATSYILTTAACLLPAGRFADIKGRRLIFISGLLFFSFASFLCVLAPSIQLLIVFRICQGLGAALIFSTGLAILAAAFPKEGRGKALGYTTAATYTGLSAGPVLGGMLTYYAGWQMIFLVTAPLALLVATAAYRFLNQEFAPAKSESYDKLGAVLYSLGLILSMYGLSFVLDDLAARLMLAGGLLILCLFVYYEFQCAYPLVDVRLFKENITFAFSNLAAMINYSATFAVGFLVSLYLQIVQGFDPRMTGWILLSQPLLMALFSPFAGRLSDRMEPRLVASAGMGLTGLGLLGFSFMDQGTNLCWIVLNLALMGLGFAFFSSPNNNAIMGSIGQEKYGLAASSLATMRMVGQALSMALTALILAYFGGSSGMLPAAAPMVLQSIQTSMLLFTGLSAIAIVFSLKRGRLRTDPELKG